jgi:hypothetical protein
VYCPLHKNGEIPANFCLAFRRLFNPPSSITAEEERKNWGLPLLDASGQFYSLQTPTDFTIPPGPAILTIDLGFEMWLSNKDHHAVLQLDLEGALASGGVRGKITNGCLSLLASRGT